MFSNASFFAPFSVCVCVSSLFILPSLPSVRNPSLDSLEIRDLSNVNVTNVAALKVSWNHSNWIIYARKLALIISLENLGKKFAFHFPAIILLIVDSWYRNNAHTFFAWSSDVESSLAYFSSLQSTLDTTTTVWLIMCVILNDFLDEFISTNFFRI